MLSFVNRYQNASRVRRTVMSNEKDCNIFYISEIKFLVLYELLLQSNLRNAHEKYKYKKLYNFTFYHFRLDMIYVHVR